MKNLAIYLRLSNADHDLGKDGKDESNSIENQRLLLISFLESRDDLDGEIVEYVDDGFSGTNFDRPSFQKMIEDAKGGKIGTIIVKDLSRLGRDYIGVGDYLEQIFPALNIRFIAVNSNYDSNNFIGKTLSIDTSLTNLINSLYSKDLSKKTRSAKIAKWKDGISTAGRQPFGYVRDYSEAHKWVIDEDAAKIVRIIFEKAASGYKTKDIVEFLNSNHYPTATKYRMEVYGEKFGNKKVSDDELLWNTGSVWRLLKNYTYTGCAVQGKVATVVVGSKNSRKVPEKDRYYIEDAVPAIVSKDLFERAQEAISTQKGRKFTKGLDNLLTGKVRCGNCRLTMCYKGTYEKYIFCQHAAITGNSSKCNREDYQAAMIEGHVRNAICNQLKLLSDLGYQLEQKQKNNERIFTDAKKYLEQRIEYLKADKIRKYEAYAAGNLDKDLFIKQKEEINSELQQHRDKLNSVKSENEENARLIFAIHRTENKASRLLENRELTPEIVDAFIDVIYVYSKERIEIVFKFEDLLEEAFSKLEKESCLNA